MCVSRIHRVVDAPREGRVKVHDLDGRLRIVSLLAYDGMSLGPGDWIVAHSGYALHPVDAAEAEAVWCELQAIRDATAK
jgi:hydrogenase maturation factor